jgi:hypothetical protein
MTSLREEMSGDLAPKTAGPNMSVTARKAKPATADATGHNHPPEQYAEQWKDDDGRRHTRSATGRTAKYLASCKACLAEDAARMAGPAPTHDWESTVFLVPERQDDQKIIRVYLEKRYPGQELFITSDIRPTRLAIRKGVSIVVLTRRRLPGQKFVGGLSKYVENKLEQMVLQEIDPADLVPEVMEAAALNVDDCVTSHAATMFDDASVDLSELRDRLCDLAAPNYRIETYQRVVGSDEIIFALRPSL